MPQGRCQPGASARLARGSQRRGLARRRAPARWRSPSPGARLDNRRERDVCSRAPGRGGPACPCPRVL